jgi:flagellar basal-body rod protein FlgG
VDKGLYISASGGLAQARALELVSNNLANVSTVGYKAERIINRQQEFGDTLASAISGNNAKVKAQYEQTPGVVTTGSMTDFSPGPVKHNGNPLNVALTDADTFFVVESQEGETYTRAGNFTMNANRELVTPDGFPVLGQGGAITIPPGGSARITSNGTVMVDGLGVDRLRSVRIDDVTQLKRTEATRFKLLGGNAEVVPTAVVPESVEMPNVNIVQAMMQMISANRGFEMYTKTVKLSEELNDTSLRTNKA